MKKERNRKKELIELYFYLDYKNDSSNSNCSTESNEKFSLIKKKFDKKFSNRYGNPDTWDEYYGIFKLKEGKIGIDPKRFCKKIRLVDKIYENMKNRNTIYFHPKKEKYDDYIVNVIVKEINLMINEFKELNKSIIKKAISIVNKYEKVCPGDYMNLAMGISGPNAAQTWANFENMQRQYESEMKKFELKNTLYAQFFHQIVSSIEAITIKMYSKINPKMKHFARNLLYDNVNIQKKSSRELPSYKYHDELYCIWNFIKHNNIGTYEDLKNTYPDVLVNIDYLPGDLAIRYVKLNDKLILRLLEGTKQYFIEWCELNLGENYSEAQWNYAEYFIQQKDDEVEAMYNPLGLQWWDDLD